MIRDTTWQGNERKAPEIFGNINQMIEEHENFRDKFIDFIAASDIQKDSVPSMNMDVLQFPIPIPCF